jgi:hypothetical protein
MHGATTADWITAVATIVVALGAFVAVVAIADNRRTTRQRLTYDYIARLESPEMGEHQALMYSLVRGCLRPPSVPKWRWARMDAQARADTAPAMWRHLTSSRDHADTAMVFRVLVYPNMLEGLAAMYNHGLLDKSIVKVSVEAEAQDFWEDASWWIAELRPNPQTNNSFRDLEVMLTDLAKQKPPSWYHADPAA